MAIPKPNMLPVSGIPASNHGGRRPARPTHITDHHIVGDAPAAIAEARKPAREMSFTYTISKDGIIYQALDPMTIPYTDTNYTSNKRAITIEHAGGHASVPYTEAMYKSSIHLHAWLRQEFNIPEQNILKHSQVADKPTACPGGLDTERIKRESTKLLQGAAMPINQITNEELTRLHRLAMSSEPGPLFIKAFESGALTPALAQLERDPNRLNAKFPALQNQLAELRKQAEELAKNPTKAEFDKLQADIIACEENARKLTEDLEKANEEPSWLTKLLAALTRK